MAASKIPFGKAFRILEKHYKTIPLEVYEGDPFKTLVSTLLSARTRDETTFDVCERLFGSAKNFHQIANLPESHIAKLIFPVGFYRMKAKNLKKTAEILTKQFGGEVPSNISDLKKLPGVGQKTANLILARAYGQNAISVDTHVHKISNLLGWVNTKTPEQTERELMKIVPRRYWREINRLLVSLGRQKRSRKKLMEFLKGNGLLSPNPLLPEALLTFDINPQLTHFPTIVDQPVHG